MPRPKTPAAAYKRLTLRVPAEMLDLLQAQATQLGRPVNTHTLFVLRYGLGLDPTPPFPGDPHGPRRARTA